MSVTVTKGGAINLSVAATGTGPFTYQWQKGGVVVSDAINASLDIAASSESDAGTYTVKVTNVVGTKESSAAMVVVNVPVTITGSPIAVTVTKRQTITLSVTATGTAPITYQWVKGDVEIPNATSSSFSLASAELADAGEYFVKVTNVVGVKPTVPVPVVVLNRDVQLSWSIPSFRVDGSSLAISEISGFIIRYGTSPTSLTTIIEIDDNTAQLKDFLDFDPATYYFQIATKDINGLQSDFSATVSKTLL